MVILVVDSVPLVLRNLDRLLSNHGHEVLTADCSEEAYEILKRDQRIRLVITDLKFAKMSAIELFKATNEIERIGDVQDWTPPKFILFTSLRPDSHAQKQDLQLLQEALDIGFVDILFKPLVREKLIQQIEDLSRGIRAQGTPARTLSAHQPAATTSSNTVTMTSIGPPRPSAKTLVEFDRIFEDFQSRVRALLSDSVSGDDY